MIMRCASDVERWHRLTSSFWTEIHISMSLKEREHAGRHLLPGPKVIKPMEVFPKAGSLTCQ